MGEMTPEEKARAIKRELYFALRPYIGKRDVKGATEAATAALVAWDHRHKAGIGPEGCRAIVVSTCNEVFGRRRNRS